MGAFGGADGADNRADAAPQPYGDYYYNADTVPQPAYGDYYYSADAAPQLQPQPTPTSTATRDPRFGSGPLLPFPGYGGT